MKKFVSVLCMMVMLISLFSVTDMVQASSDINIIINGVEQKYDVMPIIQNGRTLVPMRGIFEALGADVSWIEPTRTVVGSRDRKYVKLRIDSDTYYVNGIEQENKLDVAATIINGRTMVPVRFIAESFGENVSWDGDTKTVKITSDYLKNVAVSEKLDILPSTYHRDIPRTFTKSNDLNDLIFYEESEKDSVSKDILNLLPQGKVVFSSEEFINDFSFHKVGQNVLKMDQYGYAEVVDIEGQEFSKAMRVHTQTVPESTNQFVSTYGTVLKGRCNQGDKLLFTCKVRLLDGGTVNTGLIYPQVQNPENFKKTLFEKVIVTENWHTIYFPMEYTDGHDDVAVRFGYCYDPQVVDIADVKIINYGPEIKGDYVLPFDNGGADDSFSKDASWRKDALERIEKIRKGDFKVVVKDKDGNVVPDAKVTFDMFESQIPFGTTINSWQSDSSKTGFEEYNREMSRYFNAGVSESHMKWGVYEEDNGEKARLQVNTARANGMIYLRGHTFIMDYHKTLRPTILIPEDVVNNYGNVEYVDKRVKEWIYNVSDKFAGEVYQWDVVNEVVDAAHGSKLDGIYRNMGAEYYDKVFKWAREVNPDSALLYLEGSMWYDKKAFCLDVADNLYKNQNHFDTLGDQAHIGTKWLTPAQLDNLINELCQKYNTDFAFTEYTIFTGDEIFDANYTRDFFITALANENVNTLCLWGFRHDSKDSNKALTNPDNTLKKSGEQIVDLFYNKCFTHNANVTTNSSGEGSIRGFYGSYDVTVTHNGISKTVMAAFHKGFENVLEIVIE